MKILGGALKQAVAEVSQRAYRIPVRNNQTYQFVDKLFGIGDDRCAYDFQIDNLMAFPKVAKLRLTVYQHAIGFKPKVVFSDSKGLAPGEGMQVSHIPWRLMLETATRETATFCLLPIEDDE